MEIWIQSFIFVWALFALITIALSIVMGAFYLYEKRWYKRNLLNWEKRLNRGETLTAENLFKKEVDHGF
tara:strand:- start:9749 stop:9955 length:207 start_codon:yes stop_codon:yes gene_type:complete